MTYGSPNETMIMGFKKKEAALLAEVERLQGHANKAYDECFRLIADRDRLRGALENIRDAGECVHCSAQDKATAALAEGDGEGEGGQG